MKKVLFFGLILAATATVSCSKEYKCENADTPIAWGATYSEDDFSDSELDAVKATCEADNGDWTAQ